MVNISKRVEGATQLQFPLPGKYITVPVSSLDNREHFQMDIERKSRIPSKWTLQLRYREVTILVRLDVRCASHSNPGQAPSQVLAPYQGQTIDTPHLQRYIEGFEDGWAFPLPPIFTKIDDIGITWQEFLTYCNIAPIPLQGGF